MVLPPRRDSRMSQSQISGKISLILSTSLGSHTPSHSQGALFESPHEDENDVQTISHKCEVLELNPYVKKFGNEPKHYESIYDNNDTYYLAGHYDPTMYHIKMQPEIPVLPDNQKWV